MSADEGVKLVQVFMGEGHSWSGLILLIFIHHHTPLGCSGLNSHAQHTASGGQTQARKVRCKPKKAQLQGWALSGRFVAPVGITPTGQACGGSRHQRFLLVALTALAAVLLTAFRLASAMSEACLTAFCMDS